MKNKKNDLQVFKRAHVTNVICKTNIFYLKANYIFCSGTLNLSSERFSYSPPFPVLFWEEPLSLVEPVHTSSNRCSTCSPILGQPFPFQTLTGLQGDLIEVLFCIFFLAGEVEDLPMYLWVIWLPSCIKCLLRSFAI